MSRSKPKIVIVEDDPNDAVRLQQDLQDTYEVQVISDFSVHHLLNSLPDAEVILLDIYEDVSRLPKGLELLNQINMQGSEPIPVIVMSSPTKVDIQDIAKFLEAGRVQDFLWKLGPRATTKEETLLKVTRARRQLLERRRVRRYFRGFLTITVLVAIGAIVTSFVAPTVSVIFLAFLVVLSAVTALPWAERFSYR